MVFFEHIVSVSWVVLGAYRRIAGVVEVLVGTGGGDAFKVASFKSSLIVFRACVDVSWVVNVGCCNRQFIGVFVAVELNPNHWRIGLHVDRHRAYANVWVGIGVEVDVANIGVPG